MIRRALGVVLVLILGGSHASPRPPDDEPTFEIAARTVRVPVSVLDEAGEPVLGLTGSSFHLSEDGRPQRVSLFSGERRPLRIALALDVSASMDDKMREVEGALRYFVDLLEPDDQILVATFNDHVRLVQELTSDRVVLSNVLDRLGAAGGTALYDATLEAIRKVREGPAESKAVVLVTDGVDTASDTAFSDLREHARRMEVPVFSIGLDSWDPAYDLVRPPRRAWPRGWPPSGPGTDPRSWPRPPGTGWPRPPHPPRLMTSAAASAPGNRFDTAPLEELAEETGGRVLVVSRVGRSTLVPGTAGNHSLRKAVESIALVLRHRYLLGYEPPEGRRGWREIEVQVDRPGTTAHARKGYYAGS
jgi:VWFA-related protein